MFRTLFSLCLMVLLTINSPKVAASDAQAGWSYLFDSQKEAQTLHYSGVLTSTLGEQTHNSRVYHRADANGVLEILERLDGQPMHWVRNGSDIQCLMPDRKMVLSERRQQSLAWPKALPDSKASQTVQTVYQLEEQPTQRIAGRLVRVFELNPKDDLRYAHRLYLDAQKGLLLMAEVLTKGGTVLEHVGFSEINYSPNPLAKPEIPKMGEGWRKASIQVQALSFDSLEFVLPNQLAGFVRSEALQRTKPEAAPVQHVLYTDGLSQVSVFVQKQNASKSPVKQPVRSGLQFGAVQSRMELVGDYRVTVMGEVPDKTLQLFLKSLKWKNNTTTQ